MSLECNSHTMKPFHRGKDMRSSCYPQGHDLLIRLGCGHEFTSDKYPQGIETDRDFTWCGQCQTLPFDYQKRRIVGIWHIANLQLIEDMRCE